MIRLILPDIVFLDIEDDFKIVFNSGIFTKGSYVKAFSSALCNYTDVRYCHLATSAATALAMALKLVDIKPEDEVLVSDFSFPASANVIKGLYTKPVFIDVDSRTYNMLPDILDKIITKKTNAVMYVDALGNPSGLHDIKSICQDNNLLLIEDAGGSLGSSEKSIKCGNIVDIT